jgi:ABC-2 type transport system ATP-binding protein
VLDEPVANLDPLARRDFLSIVMAEAADRALTVILSSHLVADLERVCDHLILLSGARVQLDGDIDDLLATHAVVVGPRDRAERLADAHVVAATYIGRQATLVVRGSSPVGDAGLKSRPLTLEELVLAYMEQPDAVRLTPQLSRVPEAVKA